jgi:hypothetical protein
MPLLRIFLSGAGHWLGVGHERRRPHAAVLEVTVDGKNIDSGWKAIPVTVYPPPAEVAEHLRRMRP